MKTKTKTVSHYKYNITDRALWKRVKAFLDSQLVKPSVSNLVKTALDEFLTKHGF